MRLMTLVVRLALCGAVLGLAACGDDDGGGDTDTDTDTDTVAECVENEDCGPSGFHCEEDGTCDQECTTNDQCVQLHAMYWVCNQWGECVFEDPSASIPL
jgi:hypothetical protein